MVWQVMGLTIERPFLLAIAGKSGCGKTALATCLSEEIQDFEPTVLVLDSYYQDLAHLPFEERCRWNFDLPEALEWSLLVEHLTKLKRGRPILKPVYDFSTHTRAACSEKVSPGPLIVLEGIFALDYRIRPHLDASVFIDLPDRVAVERRLNRDVIERGRVPGDVLRQYHDQVRPAYEKYVAPCKMWADLVLRGDDPLKGSASKVKRMIRKKIVDRNRQ